jgi:hypothetical protein
MRLHFTKVISMTMDEGRAARMLGMGEDRCPYPICDHSYTMELRGWWMSGHAQGGKNG